MDHPVASNEARTSLARIHFIGSSQLEVLLEAVNGHFHHGAAVLLEGLESSLSGVIPGVHVAANGVLAVSWHPITSFNYEN